MKSQVFADFLAEFTVNTNGVMKELNTFFVWVLFVDDLSNRRGCRATILLKISNGNLIKHSLHFGFQASNNEAEYEALIAGLKLAKWFGAVMVVVSSNSQLVVTLRWPSVRLWPSI